MTIQVELSPETESRLAAQAAARRMDVPAYAASLLERAAQPATLESENALLGSDQQRAIGRKSLAQLFAESPFKDLDMEFERDRDFGRDIEL
jgi:hypothetical protein